MQKTVFGVFWNPHTKSNNSGKVFYRLTRDGHVLDRVNSMLHVKYPIKKFHIEEVIVARWDHIESETSSGQENNVISLFGFPLFRRPVSITTKLTKAS